MSCVVVGEIGLRGSRSLRHGGRRAAAGSATQNGILLHNRRHVTVIVNWPIEIK